MEFFEVIDKRRTVRDFEMEKKSEFIGISGKLQ